LLDLARPRSRNHASKRMHADSLRLRAEAQAYGGRRMASARLRFELDDVTPVIFSMQPLVSADLLSTLWIRTILTDRFWR